MFVCMCVCEGCVCTYTTHVDIPHGMVQTHHEVCDAYMSGMALPFGVSMPSQAYHLRPQEWPCTHTGSAVRHRVMPAGVHRTLTAALQGYARPARCPMMGSWVISLLSDNRTGCCEGSLGAAAPTSGDELRLSDRSRTAVLDEVSCAKALIPLNRLGAGFPVP